MPLAFKRVEESSIFLVEASQILRRDPFSPEARKKLIDGARGTYDKILVFNQIFNYTDHRKHSFYHSETKCNK